MMGRKKHTFGQRFSKFLTKIFWHLQQQPAPAYSCISQKRLASLSTKKKSNKKSGSKSYYRTSSTDRYYVSSQYPACYRTCSMRDRTTTLASIQEE